MARKAKKMAALLAEFYSTRHQPSLPSISETLSTLCRHLAPHLSLPMCAGTAVIAGGPGGAARARTGRNGAIPHDRPVYAFDGIVQNLVASVTLRRHAQTRSWRHTYWQAPRHTQQTA